MPYPRRFKFFGNRFVFWYYAQYSRYEQAVIEYHKSELCKLDINFRLNEASKELMRRREEARGRGIGPLDPEYPDLSDVWKT